MQDISSASELEQELHRKMLWLMGPLFAGLGVFYFVYSHLSAVPRFPWASVTISSSALAGVGWVVAGGRHRRGIEIIAIGVFGAFVYSSSHQFGIYSSSLWWLLVPPLTLLLAGSLWLGVATGVLLLAHFSFLALHGPSTLGSVTLAMRDPHLQMFMAEAVSTAVLLLVTALSVVWRLQLMRELERARRGATAAVEAKARFLANISHEIRTPLNGVIGAIELLRSGKASDEQRAQLVALQENSAKALLALINDVLDWSKIEAGKLKLEAEPVYLRGLVFESNELFAVTAFDKGIELTSSCNPDVPRWFVGDATRLRQIVNNLVSNAVKFTHHGGVHVHLALEGEDPRDAPLAEGRRRVRIEVADSGIGIAHDKLAGLFGAFEQADLSVTRKYGGTGLGLAISNELARMMGGRIEVSSTPGHGSTFTLIVPLVMREQADTPALPRRRSDILLASASHGLVRHVRGLLHELKVDPDVVHRLPGPGELQGRQLLLVDAPLLAEVGRHWLEQQAARGLRVVVMAPLNTDAVVGTFPQGWVLHKPVRRTALAALLDTADEPPEATPPAEPAALPLHVLLCEDNPVNQVVIQAMLAELGASCLIAANGVEALECLEQEKFDLVLMDIQMPMLDGFGATRRWRQIEAARGAARLPIVAMTANAESEEGPACREAGMDGFLAKPFGVAALRSCLAAHARGARAQASK